MITGQDLTKPLNLNLVRKGSLQRVIVFDRFDMQAMTLNTWNVLASNYLEPEFYTINGGGQQVHWSHFARFMGAKLPRRQRAQTQGWGDSELRKCLEDIMDIVASKDGIAELMQEANVDVITRVGLSDELASDQDAEIIKRYTMFSQMKSLVQMALLDGEETYDRKTLDLAGVAPVLETLMTWISGAADIPVTRLFGTSAKGLNATGEGDLTNYFNSIRSKQLTQLDPGLRSLDQVLVRSALGYFPDDYNYVWNPLQQPDSVEMATAGKTRAETDQIYLDAGVIQVSQIQRRLQAEEAYQFNDEDIEELEGLEEPNMPAEPVVEEKAPALSTDAFMSAYTALTRDGVSHESAMAVLMG
jgi:phage-related protein (TIGR01555 family)